MDPHVPLNVMLNTSEITKLYLTQHATHLLYLWEIFPMEI